MPPDLRIRSFREGKYGMINRLPAIGRFVMTSYRFENKKFIATDNDAGSLYCLSFSEVRAYQKQQNRVQMDGDTAINAGDDLLQYFKETIHFTQLAEKLLTAKNDTYIGHYPDYTLLSLTLKDHEDAEKNEAIVMVLYEDYSLLFYDDLLSTADQHIHHINRVFSQLSEISVPNLLIPYALIRHDLLTDRAFLRDIESTILELEIALTTQLKNPQNTILNLRKTLSNYKHYYLSLIDLFEDMTEDYEELLPKDADLNYQRLSNKLDRLYKYSVMLSEYVSQVNDRYRAQIDLNLNKTMKTFTILSAIFLPLTLIVGWYGMNFEGMPELGSKYGYLYVIGLSVTILTGSLLYIKKRGFWD